MKKALILAAALGALALPAMAQQSPGGTTAGGPARVGQPGEIGGGVPGTRPGAVETRMKAKRVVRKKRMKRQAM